SRSRSCRTSSTAPLSTTAAMCARSCRGASRRCRRPKKRTARAASTWESIGRSTRRKGSRRGASWRMRSSTRRLSPSTAQKGGGNEHRRAPKPGTWGLGESESFRRKFGGNMHFRGITQVIGLGSLLVAASADAGPAHRHFRWQRPAVVNLYGFGSPLPAVAKDPFDLQTFGNGQRAFKEVETLAEVGTVL